MTGLDFFPYLFSSWSDYLLDRASKIYFSVLLLLEFIWFLTFKFVYFCLSVKLHESNRIRYIKYSLMYIYLPSKRGIIVSKMSFSENLTHTGLSEMMIFWLFTKCWIWQQCCNCHQRHHKTLQSKAELTQKDILFHKPGHTWSQTNKALICKMISVFFELYNITNFGNFTCGALFLFILCWLEEVW